jgi:hypothetical protein
LDVRSLLENDVAQELILQSNSRHSKINNCHLDADLREIVWISTENMSCLVYLETFLMYLGLMLSLSNLTSCSIKLISPNKPLADFQSVGRPNKMRMASMTIFTASGGLANALISWMVLLL